MSPRRLILFAHFDSKNCVRPYILHHLEALKALGEVWFISNSPLPPSESERVKPYVGNVILRENTGLDFGMWKTALQSVNLESYDELLLTNSSIVGPSSPLGPIFERMNGTDCDFWGMTESWEMTHHLQSYFLVFRKPVIQSMAFAQFWEGVLPYTSRFNIVHSYELGLSPWLWQNGFKGVPSFPMSLLQFKRASLVHRIKRMFSKRVRKLRDPTLCHPYILLRMGMPYLKLKVSSSEQPEK